MGSVDWEAALEATAGDRALLDTVIESFLEEWRPMLAAIAEAVERRNSEQLNIAAHTLKSSLRLFGATEAEALALKLEKLGVEGPIDEAPPLLAQLSPMLPPLITELSTRRHQSEG